MVSTSIRLNKATHIVGQACPPAYGQAWPALAWQWQGGWLLQARLLSQNLSSAAAGASMHQVGWLPPASFAAGRQRSRGEPAWAALPLPPG